MSAKAAGAASGTSAAWVERARRVLPGGVSSPVRSFRGVGEEPLLAARGEGAHVFDLDGRRLVDYLQSFGPLLGGHADRRIVEAVRAALPDGTCFGLTSRGEVLLGEAVLRAWPWCERIRFVNSGTEAVMTAIRLARAATRRTLLLRFDGCYHGHSDAVLVRGGSGLRALPDASSAGVPAGRVADTRIVPLDDLGAVADVVAREGGDLAAILVEPVPANAGLLLQRDGFLRELRRLADACGALLIFDEVISGFRIAPGGASERFGVVPDLVTLGKVIGGGLPVGAIAGPARVMELLAPLGPVYQAGTLSGNPIAMAAGLASVTLACNPEFRATLEECAHGVEAAIAPLCARAPFPVVPVRLGSLLWLWTGDGPPPRRAGAIDELATRRYRRLHERLRAHGVLLAPAADEVAFVSTAHDAAVAAETAAAFERAFDDLADDSSLRSAS
jgi:glutamate-1-semialdehyde 2,1-aminomutase